MIADDFCIETERVRIRPFFEKDCGAMFQLRTDPKMYRYTPDGSWLTMDDAYDFLKFARWLYSDVAERHWFRHFFAVVLKKTDTFIGYCGLGNMKFMPGKVEVFYSIACPYWNLGYATEVARALLKYGFEDLGLERIVGFAQPENIASLRVLQKAGLKRNGEIAGLPEEFSYYNGEPFFELGKAEWSRRGD